jgi:DNA ligase-1
VSSEVTGKGVVASKTRPWPCMFLVSTYVVGKEKILEQMATVGGGLKIYVDERKLNILSCLDIDMDIFTIDPYSTPIHVVKWNFLGETWPYFVPNFTDARKYAEQYGAKKVVAFVPTGWVSAKNSEETFKIVSKGDVYIHLVPYSEHSSYQELLDFVTLLKPQQV